MSDDHNQQLRQLQSAIQRLRAAIDSLVGMSEAQGPLQAQLTEQERQLTTLTSQSGGLNLGIGATIGQTGDLVGRDKIDTQNIYLGSPGDDPASLVRRYLAGVIRETRQLTYVDTDAADAEQAAILLDQVYIRLEVATQVDRGGNPIDSARRDKRVREQPAGQLTALGALQHRGRLVLLGAPGSGKSTFARHLAYCLARAGCDEPGAEQLEPEWRHGALTPIWIELNPFAEWLGQHDRGQSAGELLWAYLGALHSPELAAELRRRLEGDAAVLLLDGLDEVPAGADGQPLKRVRAAIEALTATRRPSSVLVTCRVLDYAEPRRQLAGWATETLLPFSQELQAAFIASWFGTLAREGRALQGSAGELTARLQRAVREKPDLQRLAGNPLLLTMMATLQGAKGELPDKRVELYRECIDHLLRRWRRRAGRPDLESFLSIPGWQRADTDRLLDHLGYAAESQRNPDQGGHDAEDDGTTQLTGSAHLTRRALIDAAAAVFRDHVPNPLTYAERLCAYIDQYGSNGIVQQHGPDNYRFPHRTFREFLAARRLISNRDWPEDERGLTLRLARRATDAQWHEALLLAASLLVVNGAADSLAQLAQRLLSEHRAGSRAWAANVVAAGELLTQTDRRELAGFGVVKVWDDIVAALPRVLEPRAKPYDADMRVRAGLALGHLGDPRDGVCGLTPRWCTIPAGPFLLGSTDQDEDAEAGEKPQRQVNLPGFRISRYPVTNAQWRRFVEAGGYGERRWWSDSGWQAKDEGGWTQPDEWDDPRFNGANQPVVGISWYEATAFCRWLSERLGYDVRLPSEAEWEKAARGTDGRIYPWGNDWDAAKANTVESGINTTSSVGCFPEDRSPYGLVDVAGNVGEWTATPGGDDYNDSDGTQIELEEGERTANRGGAWAYYQRYARCAYRTRSLPSYRRPSGCTGGCRPHA